MITPSDAERILGDARPEHQFYLKNGAVVKNLYELHSILGAIDHKTFKHHVNETKNDFANWVLHVHKDPELAEKIKKAKSKEELQKHVKHRINHLHKIKAKHYCDARRHMKCGSVDFMLGLVLGISIGLAIRRFV